MKKYWREKSCNVASSWGNFISRPATLLKEPKIIPILPGTTHMGCSSHRGPPPRAPSQDWREERGSWKPPTGCTPGLKPRSASAWAAPSARLHTAEVLGPNSFYLSWSYNESSLLRSCTSTQLRVSWIYSVYWGSSHPILLPSTSPSAGIRAPLCSEGL